MNFSYINNPVPEVSAVEKYKRFDPALGARVFTPDALERAKADKSKEVNDWRLRHSLSTFSFQGKEISCDQLSRSDIDGINGYVALTGQFPPGWVGAWKCEDNTFLPIETTQQWRALYEAMVQTGQALFVRAQAAKALIAQATTVEDVLSIEP